MLNFEEYQKRRQKLFDEIPPNSVAIVTSASEYKRSGDVDYPFRQDSNFYYMTGFEEPEAVAVFIPGRREGQYVLFNRERDLDAERWAGLRVGQQGACEFYGADQAFPIGVLDQKMPELLAGRQRLYYPIGKDPKLDERVLAWVAKLHKKIRSGISAPIEFFNVFSIIHEMRLRKSYYEIDLMRQAASISAFAHRKAMQMCRPGVMEYELEAELLYEFHKQGCRSSAYTSIVGGGANACVLHYVANSAALKDGDLVLVDAAAEYQNYAADITRTYPVNGHFSNEQLAIYEIVLKAQLAVIDIIRPGVFWNELQETAVRIISQGLLDLGLLKGTLEEVLKKQSYKTFYMHSVGHWLGLDVHDVGTYKVNDHWRALESSMVFTVEPGIYISPSPSVAEKWWNIGIRIEDDVVVTKNGCDILTGQVPKYAKEIEALMKHQ